MAGYLEKGAVFDSGENRLVGVLSLAEAPSETGVLILVGGPQYRAGSHRQFTLLARSLAVAGFSSLRFDFAGMGDSEGERQAFDGTHKDIQAAIELLFASVPGLKRIVLWGLCDAASAALIFAHSLPQVAGIILLNPWVHGQEYSPGFQLSQYYRPLLTEKNYWRRLFSGRIELLPAMRGLVAATISLIFRRGASSGQRAPAIFVTGMLQGIEKFNSPVLIILSEADLTAREFSALVASDKSWRAEVKKGGITVQTIAEADHTFSQKRWQVQVEDMTRDWLANL